MADNDINGFMKLSHYMDKGDDPISARTNGRANRPKSKMQLANDVMNDSQSTIGFKY